MFNTKPASRIKIDPEVGVVSRVITPSCEWLIYANASYWKAYSTSPSDFVVGDQVYITGRHNTKLIIERSVTC